MMNNNSLKNNYRITYYDNIKINYIIFNTK